MYTYISQGDGFAVTVSRTAVLMFRDKWPCSTLPDAEITFEFARNGDLVAFSPDGDGSDWVALSNDARDFGLGVHSPKWS